VAHVRYLVTVFRLICMSRAIRLSPSPAWIRRTISRISSTVALLPAKGASSGKGREESYMARRESGKCRVAPGRVQTGGPHSPENGWHPFGRQRLAPMVKTAGLQSREN
jgi:hypothetical protein